MPRVVIIKCEGPICNGGLGAKDRAIRNAELVPVMTENRVRVADDMTTTELVDRQHEVVALGRARCKVCGYERKW